MTKLDDIYNSCRQTILRAMNENNLVTPIDSDFSSEIGLDLYDSIISELSSSVEELVEASEIRDKFEMIRRIMEKRKNRIIDLEDALKGSIKLSLEREMVLQKEEERSKNILEKVGYYKVREYLLVIYFFLVLLGFQIGAKVSITSNGSSDALSQL